MKGIRAALSGPALILSMARVLLPFLLTTYLSFRLRRWLLIRKLVKDMVENGVSGEHAKRLSEAIVPDPVKLIREVIL